MNTPRWRSLVVTLAAVVLLTSCAPAQQPQPSPTPQPTSTPVPVTVDLEDVGAIILGSPPPDAAASDDLLVVTFDASQIVDRVRPAVVTVINEQQFNDGFFGETEVEAGRGTGFIIDNAGHVVTNQHVVSGGSGFQVILANGENRDATLVGADPRSDLAVVRMDGPIPASVSFGDSNTLKQGQPVLAIGSPLGDFTGTVTAGIVSALGRDFPLAAAGSGEEGIYTDLIQHDAAINPDNSGGPLFDIAGRVIGVNTLGIPQSGMTPVQGLFFAIPANQVARITDELIETGEVAYPLIGISFQQITPDLAAQNDLPVDYGGFVQATESGGPADEAGIVEGDIILGIGDQRISGQTTFTEALFANDPGDTVPVTVLRDGQERQFQVTLGRR